MAGPMDFVTEAFVLLGIALGVIGLRTYARWKSVGWANFQWDDYLMIFSGIIYSLETAAAYTVVMRFFGLANNGMTDEQRAALRPTDPEWDLRVGGSKTQMVGWSLYTLLLWSLKLCMAIFYSRLTEGLHMNMRVKIAYVSIAVTYVATISSIMFGCWPFEKNWQIYPDPGLKCQPAISRINLYVTVVLNVLTDLYLMSIPLPLLWKASLSPKRKILLLTMFSGGAFIIIAGILRCALIIADPINGAAAAGSWAVRETFVAAIIGNIPMIYPLFARTVSSVSKSVKSSGFGSSAKRSHGGSHMELGDRSFDKPSKPLRRKMNPMSIGMTTMGPNGDSAERLAQDQADVASTLPPRKADSAEKTQGISVVREFTMTQQGASTASLDDPEHRPRDIEQGHPVRPSLDQGRPAFGPSGYSVRIQTGGGAPTSPTQTHARQW